jgi:hypothetical protein
MRIFLYGGFIFFSPYPVEFGLPPLQAKTHNYRLFMAAPFAGFLSCHQTKKKKKSAALKKKICGFKKKKKRNLWT